MTSLQSKVDASPEPLETAGSESQGRLTLIHVEPEPSEDDVHSALASTIPHAALNWCDARIVVAPGSPARSIAELAGAIRADLIVVGRPQRALNDASRDHIPHRCSRRLSCLVGDPRQWSTVTRGAPPGSFPPLEERVEDKRQRNRRQHSADEPEHS